MTYSHKRALVRVADCCDTVNRFVLRWGWVALAVEVAVLIAAWIIY